MTNPIAIEAQYDSRVDSFYRGSIAVCDDEAIVRLACADVELPISPRSALKPIQALPLLETGAAEAFVPRHADVSFRP